VEFSCLFIKPHSNFEIMWAESGESPASHLASVNRIDGSCLHPPNAECHKSKAFARQSIRFSGSTLLLRIKTFVMLIKSLLIASSLMAVDGRQMLRNQAERDLAWGGDAHPVPVPVAPAKPSWKGDGNSAVPLKKTPVKGSGKKTLIMRKKKKDTMKQVVGMKPKKEPVNVVKIQGSKGNTVYVKPSKIRPAPVTSTKWGNDGFQPLVTPKPTQKPVSKWGNDGFQPLVTPKPTQKPVSKWGNDGFQPLVTPKPTKKPSSKWGNDGHCMYRPNADYTKCTNDDNVSSDYMYSTLEKCCEAVFGMGECDYEEVCIPCEEQLFFFDGDKCVNDVFFAGAPAYSTAVACCNLNFGIGSYANGSCDYIDVCAPEPVVTPAPTVCEEMVFFLDGNTCTNDIYIADAVAYSEYLLLECKLCPSLGAL
jgi:hypothetical protein